MDGLSSVASIIAVIQLTGSLVKLCGGYIREVKDAKDEILNLQRAIINLQGTLQGLQNILQDDKGKALPTSSRLASDITDCLSDLQALEARLDPGKGKRLMKKVGLRALKWPLKRTEVEALIKNLERYKHSFLLSLQVDQTSLMIGMVENTNRTNQHIDLAKLEGASDAGFKSFSDRDEIECLQGTRTELLQEIMEWTLSSSSKSIFWLEGMAGTGKSTISRTVARSLSDTNHLGASFFFKRGEGDRGNAKKFFPTLARQITMWNPELTPGVQKAINDDPDITSKSLKEQFEKLLLQPLLSLDRLDQQPQTTVIVVDALDECEHDPDVENIIKLLPLLQKVKSVRLRIFLTSRPEPPISREFSKIGNHEYQNLALHEIPEEVTERDIHLFLQHRFAEIKRIRKISQDWPGDNIIQELVRISVPLFISAATVCHYIEHSRLEPKSRLAELLKDQAKYVSRMDKTYLPILTQLLNGPESDESELLQEFQDIVGVIILLELPLSIYTLSRFLGIGVDQISNRLDSFRSVLSIPGDLDQPVRILHLSFREFLVQSKGKFHVDEQERNKKIAKSCLKTMRSHLHRDICCLTDPGVLRADINPLDIRHYLPPELQYSCRYWIHHVKKSQPSSSEIEETRLFFQTHFLHWMEAMSLLGRISEVVVMLDLIRTVIPDDDNSFFANFLHDAKRFVLKNRQISDEAPLQIYCAGLVFAPQEAIIRREFQSEVPGWISQFPQVQETWSSELQALEGHTNPVRSVAFSPDGRLLASGSHDNTVRFWDPATGTLQQTLEGHTHWVVSVAFSPNGRLLASGSNDTTVRLWDPATGALQQTLEGHTHWVESVAFSHDDRLLASSSYDKTIRLWDLATGALQQTLEGHIGSVQSVAFSPDGRLLASGSYDNTIRLWDLATGALQQNLKGHTESVELVAFSPNGRLLASSSYDTTVRLWDPATGALQKTLKGHTGSVESMAFSPNGRLLASGSISNIIQLWDPAAGALQQTLEGHTGSVQSVAFSPDGRLLASASYDDTVRLWDPAPGALQQTLEGHKGSVESVAFSPDGRLLASGSYDTTVRLWDPATGTLQQTLKGHTELVKSVAFSPDGRLLASGSYDNTIRLWDLAIGALEETLKGHTESVESVAFSPDGRLLASGSYDNTVRLWDPTIGALQQTFEGHAGLVESVAFSPDGRLLASGSYDNTIRLWDLATGALEETLSTKGFVKKLEFSQDGSYLSTNLGSFKIQSGCGNLSLDTSSLGPEISLEREWIVFNGEQVLWLPPEARHSCSTTRSNTIALGHRSGRVSFIGFRE